MEKAVNNSVLLLFLVFSFFTFSQNEKAKDSIQAKIRLVKNDNFINLYAEAINYSRSIQSELNYSMLSVKKNGEGNLSRNIQSGEFSILLDEVKTLSNQKLNISATDEIKVYLFVRKKDKLISKDSLRITAIDDKYSNTPIFESNLELGLIVENVMTKLGKDFYDFFSQINQLNSTNYPFVIVVNEKPSLGGRNSEINILINDETVYRFRTQPKEEYLYNNAKEANRIIYNYYVKKKLLRKKKRIF